MDVAYLRKLTEISRSNVAILRKRRIAKTVDFQGVTVRVDRPQGFVQRGKDEKGNAWERTYKVDYGYIPKTQGGDGDGLDVYLGPDSHAQLAYWIQQRKAAGEFDEYKLMLGFPDRRAAKAMWEAHTPQRFYGGVATTSMGVVKSLLGVEPVAIGKGIAAMVELDGDALIERLTKSINNASTAALLLEAGPPVEWSGAVASILGDRKADIVRLWDALDPATKERVTARFQQLFDSPPASFEDDPLAIELRSAYGELAKAEPVALRERTARLVKASADDEERYVLGVVLEPDIVDAQGDTYDAETIRQAAWIYMMEYQNRGLQHEQLVNHAVKLVESYLAPIDMTVGASAIKAGTWLAGFFIPDDTLWAEVKSGAIGGFSIGGVATKLDPDTGKPIPPPPDKARYQPE